MYSAIVTSVGLGLWTNAIVRRFTIKSSHSFMTYQSELQWIISMEFQWKHYNEREIGYAMHRVFGDQQWSELQFKRTSPRTHQSGNVNLRDYGAKQWNALEQFHGRSVNQKYSGHSNENMSENKKQDTLDRYIRQMVVSDSSHLLLFPVVCPLLLTYIVPRFWEFLLTHCILFLVFFLSPKPRHPLFRVPWILLLN